jgi:hypothetical protein
MKKISKTSKLEKNKSNNKLMNEILTILVIFPNQAWANSDSKPLLFGAAPEVADD